MRSLALALALAGSLVLLGGVRDASAQASMPCAVGTAVPFSVPLVGVDPAGRAFSIKIAGWYGPYDGFGYPGAANTFGIYGGQPINRWDFGYFPNPCPILPAPPVTTAVARDS
jgi:hypothetical protein